MGDSLRKDARFTKALKLAAALKQHGLNDDCCANLACAALAQWDRQFAASAAKGGKPTHKKTPLK